DGTLNLEQVGLISNHAALGGGIYNAGSLVSHDSTFTDNSAQRGGAVYNAPGATAYFFNTTFSGNSATFGGGLYNQDGRVDLDNVTMNLNTAITAGAAIDNAIAASPITARDTIVAGSSGGGATQCNGGITSNGHNLNSDNTCGFN